MFLICPLVREYASFLFILGGVNFKKRTVSERLIEVNVSTSYVSKQRNIPVPKFAHGATICGSELVITSGISDLMIDMGMRCVPMGDTDCYSYDVFEKTWRRLPDVPIGKLHPTLVTVNSRFVYQIGGFDDYNFEIYRLDMKSLNRPWRVLGLRR